MKTLEQEHKTLKRSNSSLKKEAEGQREEKNRLQEELQAQVFIVHTFGYGSLKYKASLMLTGFVSDVYTIS